MNDSAGVGARASRARKLAGLSQRELAARAHVSLSLLRKVEQGDRPASPAFTAAIAAALGLSPDALYGQPYEATSRTEAAVHAAIPELRRALVAFDDNELPNPPRSLADLLAGLDEVRETNRRARFGAATAALPDVLRGLQHAATIEPVGQRRERVMTALAYAYSKAMLSAYQFGYLDLAGLAAERCCWAAGQSGDPLWSVAAEYNRALILLYSGAYNAGLRVIDRAYVDTEDLPTEPNTLAVRGALHLRGSILSARAANAQTAETHLAAARDIAEQLTGERFDHYGTGFRRSNVDIHSVSVPVELCDGTTAITRAAELHLPPNTAPSRIGHHHIDVSRGWLLHGDRQKAVASLQDARRVAPELTRYHPQVHEMIRTLARDERRTSTTVAGLARWADVTI
ncbi:MAG: helix-turn-helix transcriptional regulator [Nocardioidaceae bacterium]